VQAIWVQEGSSVYLGARVISLPEMPARAVTKGDFVVIYVRRVGIYVGRVTDEGNSTGAGEALRRMYSINLEWFFGTRWSLPRDLWALFSVQPQLILDPNQVALLNEVIDGTRTVSTSVRHILFDELADPPASPVIGDLVLIESMRADGSSVSFCEACKMVCTEVLGIDHLDTAIDRDQFVSWDALSGFAFRLREALDDGWFERAPDEKNLDVARRYLDVVLGDWADDLETPILFGLRRGTVERWSWILVAFSSDGEHPSSIKRAFSRREDAEGHLPALGCRTSADLGPEQLRALGIDDPDGLTL
jgi:hypothetical protein